ncbi:uncharacterized protein LOC106158913 [Lingula anatina]|uniref:Uncharacterized protein LOC106158913 n=1 Tax=Lingula anatina TaxID=7574 RepID=A0A1S3HWU9_LINAN|nr:uncharacterized protein LOC106158913 [Lingula anatina]|eukprot:XP_013390493.1 uncharacterized protein LOC106158913 [Lingula anatina]
MSLQLLEMTEAYCKWRSDFRDIEPVAPSGGPQGPNRRPSQPQGPPCQGPRCQRPGAPNKPVAPSGGPQGPNRRPSQPQGLSCQGPRCQRPGVQQSGQQRRPCTGNNCRQGAGREDSSRGPNRGPSSPSNRFRGPNTPGERFRRPSKPSARSRGPKSPESRSRGQNRYRFGDRDDDRYGSKKRGDYDRRFNANRAMRFRNGTRLSWNVTSGCKGSYNCCLGLSFDQATQFCCAGVVHNMGTNNACCRGQPFQTATHKCCSGAIRLITDPAPCFQRRQPQNQPGNQKWSSFQNTMKPSSRAPPKPPLCAGQAFDAATQFCCAGIVRGTAENNACCRGIPYNSASSNCIFGEVQPKQQ